MIITRRWLEEFINISNISTDEICKTLNSIGLEVDSVEKKSGASNVEAGQTVAVATIGAILGNDFKIKAAKLRGVESNGMICSSTELGLPKLNDGIMVLDNSIGELILGKELKDYPSLNDDIIEIGLTPNRGDCLSILGVARELAAFYDLPLIELDKNINSSNIDTFLAYKAIDFSSFKLDLVTNLRVSLIGKFKENSNIKNSLVYTTHSIGVILNAYPREDFVLKNELSVLDLRKNEKGFDCSYSSTNCLSQICVDQKDFSENSNDFLLEASYINPEVISKRVFDAKIKTGDIFYKASRGSNPDLSYGVNYFSSFASKMGATIYSGAKEFLEDIEKITLSISVKNINSIIGQDIEKIEIERILTSLEFEIKESVDDILLIKVPHYRHDIKNIADIAEEVIRMVGIDNIISKPLAIDEVNRVNKTSLDLQKKNKLRYKAIENGFFETLTYVFSSKENLEKYS